MRAMWSGAVSFGLVSVPVKLYSATADHDIRFHQVHSADGGRIQYKRVCTVCGEEVDYADIVKGYELEDGELVMLTEADLNALPVSSSREIDVLEFVPADQIDPMLFDKSYYLEPETKAAKPYALLREALRETNRMAVVKVTLRQKEALALLRVQDKTIVLQTMLWPDEVRQPEFEILEADVELRPQEMQMAASLIDSLGADFDPSRFSDEYREAVVELIERKRAAGDTRPPPAPAADGDVQGDAMTDLLDALERSVAAARASSSGEAGASPSVPTQRAEPSTEAKPSAPAQKGKPKSSEGRKPSRRARNPA
ncbi:MAG: Ku protein [Pseudonocardia sp.]|nr:Ku protein [Pseudonocardia sp.]